MKWFGAALLCAAALLAAAVAGSVASAGPGRPPSVAKFSLYYERSGGFLPNPQSLRIRPGRHAFAKGLDRSPPGQADGFVTARFRIGVRRVKRLRGALERADFRAIDSPGPDHGNCADCFTYWIEYRGHSVRFSQAKVPPGLRRVVYQLESTVAHHLPFH